MANTTPSADVPPAPTIVDDKSPICIPFILSRLREERPSFFAPAQDQAAGDGNDDDEKEKAVVPPFIVGLNGVQGVGKTTLVRALAERLRRDEGLETLVCSIDDFYLTHADQRALAAAHPDNPLVQVRGEPGKSSLFLSPLLSFSPVAYPVPCLCLSTPPPSLHVLSICGRAFLILHFLRFTL